MFEFFLCKMGMIILNLFQPFICTFCSDVNSLGLSVFFISQIPQVQGEKPAHKHRDTH